MNFGLGLLLINFWCDCCGGGLVFGVLCVVLLLCLMWVGCAVWVVGAWFLAAP